MPLTQLNDAVWLKAPSTQGVLTALETAGHEARVVGGAVRNALLGRPVKDVDVATTATPQQSIAALNAAGFRTFETGITHGTITAVAGQTPIEVTTLRRDEETDGRHARVAFTSDWAEDAARRDFTINALYCDANGTLFDPLGSGLSDIAQRRVRFIGGAEDRIKEDYLRILRFFRFTADYAGGVPDQTGLEAVTMLKDGIVRLSGERRRMEVLRIVPLPDAGRVLAIMQEAGILALTIGCEADVALLGRVAGIEQAQHLAPDAVLRLGALALKGPADSGRLRDTLRLSAAEDDRLSNMAMPDRALDASARENDAKAYIYRHGGQSFSDGVILAWARSAAPADDAAWSERLNLAQRWQAPELPVRGADILALGIAPGPDVGRVLSQFEDWWIASGFPMTPALIARRLQHMVSKA